MKSRLACLFALVATFLGQPLSRSINRLFLDWFGEWAIVSFIVLGFSGVVLVAVNLNSSEIRASIAGFISGLMIWRGFFDGPLRFFSNYFTIQPVDFGGFPLGGRYALLMSSLTMMIAVLLLYGFMNRETKCSFMRFTLRLVHWSPGTPTQDLHRSFARIAAMETVFVQWGIFLLFLFLGGWLGSPFYLAMLAWSAFLIFQLFRHKRAGSAFRYAIPVSVIIWSLAEVGAFFGMYPEIWQAPTENPFGMLMMLALFIVCLFMLLRGDDNSLRTG